MKRVVRLGLFSFVVILFIGEALVLSDLYSNRMYKLESAYMRKLRENQIALTMVSFYSYYHSWPILPGQLDTNAYIELSGSKESKINIQRINFFEKNDFDGCLVDERGQPFYFKPDESLGACSIYDKE